MILVTVRVRDCACPDHRHDEPTTYPDGVTTDGDVVFVAPTLPLEGGLQAETDRATALADAIASGGPKPKDGFSAAQQSSMAVHMAEHLRRRWLVTYVRYGAKDWNFCDQSGPMPFDAETIIADYRIAAPVADKCDELYGETVALPLLRGPARPSQRGQTRRSTSRKTTSTRARPASSSRPNGRAASRRLTA